MVTKRQRKSKDGVNTFYDIRFYAKGENVKLIENFCFLYGDDVMKQFFFKCLDKAVDSRDFLEYCLFDDIDDFICHRGVINDARRGN